MGSVLLLYRNMWAHILMLHSGSILLKDTISLRHLQQSIILFVRFNLPPVSQRNNIRLTIASQNRSYALASLRIFLDSWVLGLLRAGVRSCGACWSHRVPWNAKFHCQVISLIQCQRGVAYLDSGAGPTHSTASATPEHLFRICGGDHQSPLRLSASEVLSMPASVGQYALRAIRLGCQLHFQTLAQQKLRTACCLTS